MARLRRCAPPFAIAAAARAAARPAAVLGWWVVMSCALAVPSGAAAAQGRAAGLMREGGESQIDESSPDQSAPAPGRPEGPATLPDRLREYAAGSLASYDALKNESAGFRRQGWFPSLYLRDPDRDVEIAPGAGGKMAVTVHISFARRDLEQRLVIGPADRFELPGADKQFFAELIGALATASPEVAHASLRFWFAVLRPDGRMAWESRGGIGLSAAAASRFPTGSRTAEAIWPLLDENTLPASAWGLP